jgi:hypothetical protein
MTANELPAILHIDGKGDCSLSVARCLRQAIDLIEKSDWPKTIDPEDGEVILGNLQILLSKIK